MKKNLLMKKLKIIQNDYLSLLKSSIKDLDTINFELVVDEINVFWELNKNVIKIALDTIGKEYDCYVFTGASFLDVDDYEHYPFLALGNFHIVDDPLPRYSNMLTCISEEDFSKELKEQLVLTFYDNIKILEEYAENICILPIGVLSRKNLDDIIDISDKIFISLFSNPDLTIDTYLESYISINDVEKGIHENINRNILFTEDDELGSTLSSRYTNYVSTSSLPFSNKNDAHTFLYLIQGNIIQVLRIYLLCSEYNFTPYIRYNVSFNYMLLLRHIYIESPGMENVLFKSIVSYILYRHFDKNKIKDIEFCDYVNRLRMNHFGKNVFDDICNKNIDIRNGSIEDIAKIIMKRLNEILNTKAK